MSKVQFEATVPLDMVIEVVTEIRSGKLTLETAKKILWVLGCTLEKVKPSQLITNETTGLVDPDADIDEVFSLLDEIKRTIDQSPFIASSSAETPVGSIPPAVWAMLFELVTKLLLKR